MEVRRKTWKEREGRCRGLQLCPWRSEGVVVEVEEEGEREMKTVRVVVRSEGSTRLGGGGGGSGLRGKRESWWWWQCGGVQGFLSPQGRLLHSPH